MIANNLAEETAEGRNSDRSNVFVIAALYSAGGSAPVRIRNLSPSGALIEGAVLPLPGAPVRLSRGSFHVSGEVVWSADGRAGLRFGSSISVPEWLPGANSAMSQQRVDEIVFKSKQGSQTVYDSAAGGSGSLGGAAVELAHLASELSRLGEQLSEDAHVALRFPESLQIIEATAQRLDRLATAALTP